MKNQENHPKNPEIPNAYGIYVSSQSKYFPEFY